MKLQESKLILLSAFEHEPETRAEYFKIEAEKSGYSLETFYNELSIAYETLNKYVNSKDYSFGLCTYDDGSEGYPLKIIPIDNFTDGRVLDNENITELLQPMADFGAFVLACSIANIKFSPPQDNNTPPQGETTKQKIEKALEPLRKAFEDTGKINPETGIKTDGHIDKIIEALAEYAEGTTPDCVENQRYNCMNIKHCSNKDFYTPFKGLNKTIGLTVEKIAEVLHYFIYANDGSQNAITIKAIKRNINVKYPKVI